MLSPDSGSKILGSSLLGCGRAPPLPMQNVWLHGNMLAGGQVRTGNGLRSAAGGVDTAWPLVRLVHHAGKLGRSPRPACVCNQEEAAAVWLLVLMQRVTCQTKLLPVFLTKPGTKSKPGENGALLFVYAPVCVSVYFKWRWI